MGLMSDADILIDEMQVWSTAELMDVWANSDDAAERYAARHIVIERGRAEQRFWDGLLEYGQANPEKARMIEH